MPKWLKVVLIVLASLVLLCGIGVGGVMWWFDQNKDALKAKGEKMAAEAKAFAQTSDSAGCLKESFVRLKAKSGFMDEVEHRIFLNECLDAAPKAANFCDGVPSRNELIQAALWANQSCEGVDAPKEPCGRLMQEVLAYCDKSKK